MVVGVLARVSLVMTDIVTGASSSADSAFVAVTTTTSFSVARARVIAGTSTLVPATVTSFRMVVAKPESLTVNWNVPAGRFRNV